MNTETVHKCASSANVLHASNFLEKNNLINLSFDEIIKSIKEISKYCSEKNDSVFSEKVAEWIIEHSILQQAE